jgi:vesicle-associated membrane protein 4
MASALQAQVDDTVYVMRENINKALEQRESLDSLQGKSNGLDFQYNRLRRDARKVGWDAIKSRICLISSVVIVLLIMVVIPILALILQHGK